MKVLSTHFKLAFSTRLDQERYGGNEMNSTPLKYNNIKTRKIKCNHHSIKKQSVHKLYISLTHLNHHSL